MKKELVCVMCPNGCNLEIDDKSLEVKGNLCPKGVEFAKTELNDPKRGVSSLVRTTIEGYKVLPVRTSGDISKKLIFPLMEDLKKVVITSRLPIGSVVIKNYKDTGIDIITTKSMEEV